MENSNVYFKIFGSVVFTRKDRCLKKDFCISLVKGCGKCN